MADNNIKIEEVKTTILERVPPGDQWKPVDSLNAELKFSSLTDALEWQYQKTGDTQFYISARDGIVQVVQENKVEVEPEIKSYGLYGER